MPSFEERLSFRLLTEPPTLKALQKFQEDAGWSISRKDREKQLGQQPRIQWVSVEMDQVKVAIARLELAPPEFCYVADLIVKSKFRGQGVGRWFIAGIERFCAPLGIRRLTLVPEAGSLPFYEALGFVPDGVVAGVWKKDMQLLQRKRFF
ncbi:MAG: GNAT family N-acetyltransferase [Burkholderiaceae bacterium]|nr:GNAT family N-acetyltransferase [Burkholderiaceae bacterium]